MSSSKQRSHPRCACSIPVTLTFSHAETVTMPAVAVNIGLGGMYVEADAPITFNSSVRARFRLPSLDEDTVVDGTVRWVKDKGAGIQFGSLRARDVWALNQLLRTVA